jgi:hypothetical protein
VVEADRKEAEARQQAREEFLEIAKLAVASRAGKAVDVSRSGITSGVYKAIPLRMIEKGRRSIRNLSLRKRERGPAG